MAGMNQKMLEQRQLEMRERWAHRPRRIERMIRGQRQAIKATMQSGERLFAAEMLELCACFLENTTDYWRTKEIWPHVVQLRKEGLRNRREL
jgi:hypothetical protein